ncbi:MAG TPA: TRAP transporter TatT component family protein [Polyangia bacterium]
MQRLFSATAVGRVFPTVMMMGLVASCGTGRQSQWQTTPATVAATASVPPSGDAEADWNNRGDQAALERAIATWEAQVAAKPDDGEALARLSRAYYVLADGHLRTLGPKDQRYLGAFEKGTAAGERALAALSPAFKEKVTRDEKVEEAIKVVGKEGLSAMYWYAVNLGKWSRAKGIAALLGNKDRVKGVLERVLALDETFFHGAAHRYFGVYWALLPVGRDLDKSRTHFERSLAIAPNYVGTKVLMAEAYAVKKQDRALFSKLLAEVQAAADDAIPELAAETRFEKAKARELEAKIDELF